MKKMAIISLLFLSGTSYSSTPKNEKITCLSTREYITTVQFLRDQQDFGFSEKEILSAADHVSKGCSGASERFIKVTKLLTKLGIDTRSSIGHAKKLAPKSDSYTEAFIEIFKHTYDPKFLDLDALNAMNISVKLSAEFEGDIQFTLDDFTSLVEYCVRQKGMDLPTPRCAKLATDVTRLGQEFEAPIAENFIDLMAFLQESSKGPKLDRNTSLKISMDVLKNGPSAGENFSQAYRFALSKKGLGYSVKKAINFGKKMASRSFELKSEK